MTEITGLTQTEALQRLQRDGRNELPEAETVSVLGIFFSQFKSPFIYILLAATVISLAIGQNINAIFIMAVLLLNAIIGTFQEYAAQHAASSLKKMVPQKATVVRDGIPMVIDSAEIVVGDIVMLASGDKIAADLKLIDELELEIDESTLTGESLSVEKDASFVYEGSAAPAEIPLGDRLDMAFAGTVVLRGRGHGEVVSTGTDTEIGKIAIDVSAEGDAPPPLMQRIQKFTKRITWGILIIIAAIFVITIARGDDLSTVFLLGVALAVSAIPEGLPVAITVALAIGMKRMAAAGVIIRKLVAVESLGSCTYIASDKTGTLTMNELTVRKIVLADGSSYTISGEGMNMHGEIQPDTHTSAGDDSDSNQLHADAIQLLTDGGVLANEAYLEFIDGIWVSHGDHVDIALLVLMNKIGSTVEDVRKRNTEVARIPYESNNAYSASINRYGDRFELFVKGSVERVIEMCDHAIGIEDGKLRNIEHISEKLAAEGYRVLGLAHRSLDQVEGEPAQYLEQLEFIGMVAIIDPLRPEAIDAVRQCRDGGIKVAMVTGDHPFTAEALSKELGIARKGYSRDDDKAVTGIQLKQAEEQDGKAFDELVSRKRIFARVAPHQKMQIVESLIGSGEFVAVTGDGVNDAPALKHAHVGIAMGKRGSDVARESSDLILTDDHFMSIVQGIKQGRIVYNNIRKVIFLLISTGAAEITLVILSILMGLPLPLMPLQLLWLNLVTNGIQDVALVFEPEEGHELQRQPRKPDEPIFDRLMIERVVLNAIFMGCLAFAIFYWQISQGIQEDSARNVTLLLMVLFENVHVFNSRSETISIFRQNFFGNPLLLLGMITAQCVHIAAMHMPGISDVLKLEPVTLTLWAQLLGIALLLIIIDELHKVWHNWKQARSIPANVD
jgi:P-type Ca2+ transporter type 2C